jgi:hypothetical protein
VGKEQEKERGRRAKGTPPSRRSRRLIERLGVRGVGEERSDG